MASSPLQKSRRGALELLAVSALAVAQPLFDLLGGESAFFVAHRTGSIELLLFTAIVYLGVPFGLWLVGLLLGRLDRRLGRIVHAITLGFLVALLALPPFDRLELSAPITLVASLALGAAAAARIERSSRVRSFLALLAPVTVLVPIVFLFLSPATKILRPHSVEALAVEVGNPRPVVVVILDELPLVSLLDGSRSIDESLYPNFARLAASSQWFRNATSVSPATDYAVPAILAGLYPEGEHLAIASGYPRSLFTVLGGHYEMLVNETQTQLCPPELCDSGEESAESSGGLALLLTDSTIVYLHIVTPSDLRPSLPEIGGTWGGFLGAGKPAAAVTTSLDELHIWAAERTEVFEGFLRRLDRVDSAPALHFVHLMLPHIPWVYLPSGKEYWGSVYSAAFPPGVDEDKIWTTEEWQLAQGYQRHLLQVGYVDRMIGRVIERMEESGLWDEAVLVVVSDHGLSFQPGQPGRDANLTNYADIMAVPMFVRVPGQDEGSVSDQNAEIIDVLPTIADVLEIDLPFTTDGSSLLSGEPERRYKIINRAEGANLTFEPAQLDIKYESVERKIGYFADGLFAIGPHPDLLDRDVGDIPQGEPWPVRVRLDQAAQFDNVELEGRFLPAQIFGRVRWEGLGEQLTLAISVNGVTRAVTKSFGEQRDDRFVAMVPEASFIAGDNAIDVFVIEEREGETILHPTINAAAPTYALEEGPDGSIARIVASDGTSCTLDSSTVQGGYLQHGTGFTGWARDPSGQRPYMAIITFADGRLVHTMVTGLEPSDSSPIAGQPGWEKAGFRYTLPASLIDSTRELRIFGVLGEKGTELFRAEP
jgi:hypothetical protein